MTYNAAIERRDYSRIDKLNEIKDSEKFWQTVKTFTKNTTGDHALRRWQCLAEQRYEELNAQN